MQKLKLEKLKCLGEEKSFQLAFENVQGMNSTNGDGRLFHARGAAKRTSGHQVMTWYVALRQSQTWQI